MRAHRTLPIAELMSALILKLVGYYGVTDNGPRRDALWAEVR